MSLPRLRNAPVPGIAAGLAFLVLFWEPLSTLVRDWWSEPDAGHGLLLGPIAIVLAWRRGLLSGSQPNRWLGVALLVGAVLLRYASGLAAELFTMRLSMLAALSALIVFAYGLRQLAHWWLPIALLVLSIPLPSVVLSSLALPLQLEASQLGTTLLEWRNVPVLLSGNVINLPGRSLFVTEACSGLRSLTALVSLGVLIGGVWLRYPMSRILLVLAAVPVAMILNGARVFLTGFLVYYVDPRLGEGFLHYTEGWAIFIVAFAILATTALMISRLELAYLTKAGK